ncbi:MAG: DNA replication/repair protein RecF [Bacilli bacterium]|nr:DNA replication/repair protein RecF [Bacilli bacterium]
MIINNLKLRNFRNYSYLDIELSKKLNIFIGNNAQGKSNLLESIVVLALTKSYLNVKDENLIKDGENVSILEANVNSLNTNKKLFVSFSNSVKKLKINDVEIKKYIDYVSNIKFVLFSPMDITLIKDSPAVRRKYFNIEISQISNNYIKLLQKYNVLLKKRNQFLKSINDISFDNDYFINILDDNFSTLALDITFERKKFIDDINNYIGKIYYELTGDNGLMLVYNNSIPFDEDKELMKNNFIDKLKDNYMRDKLYGMTLNGPHRDDYSIYLDGKDLSLYGSQGQNRSAILALKLSLLDIFKDITNDYPILLLDDIFSELDLDKRNRLIKYIMNDIQTIITTTDLDMIDESLVNNAKVFIVDNGNVNVLEKEGNKHE